MYSNATRSNRPTAITPADHARMARAAAAWDERIARARRRERVARLAYVAGALALAVHLFYTMTN